MNVSLDYTDAAVISEKIHEAIDVLERDTLGALEDRQWARRGVLAQIEGLEIALIKIHEGLDHAR